MRVIALAASALIFSTFASQAFAQTAEGVVLPNPESAQLCRRLGGEVRAREIVATGAIEHYCVTAATGGASPRPQVADSATSAPTAQPTSAGYRPLDTRPAPEPFIMDGPGDRHAECRARGGRPVNGPRPRARQRDSDPRSWRNFNWSDNVTFCHPVYQAAPGTQPTPADDPVSRFFGRRPSREDAGRRSFSGRGQSEVNRTYRLLVVPVELSANPVDRLLSGSIIQTRWGPQGYEQAVSRTRAFCTGAGHRSRFDPNDSLDIDFRGRARARARWGSGSVSARFSPVEMYADARRDGVRLAERQGRELCRDFERDERANGYR